MPIVGIHTKKKRWRILHITSSRSRFYDKFHIGIERLSETKGVTFNRNAGALLQKLLGNVFGRLKRLNRLGSLLRSGRYSAGGVGFFQIQVDCLLEDMGRNSHHA